MLDSLSRRPSAFQLQAENEQPRSGAGLVPYSTSDTAFVAVSNVDSRLRRMKHHVRTAGRLISETMARTGRKWRAVFVTLTYREGVVWEPRHVADYFKNLRTWASRQGFVPGYVWVAEMQKRGAVHYHACIWIPRHLQLPLPDRKVRPWWPHGSSNVQSVRRNAVGYLMKYVSKGVSGRDPDFPRGARICGSGGLDKLASDEFHYWRLPRYVRQNVQIGDRCMRAKGGGWVRRSDGRIWRSDFGLFAVCRRGREADCRGAPRRDERLILLHRRYKRGLGCFCGSRHDLWQHVVTVHADMVRESSYYLVMGDSSYLLCLAGLDTNVSV